MIIDTIEATIVGINISLEAVRIPLITIILNDVYGIIFKNSAVCLESCFPFKYLRGIILGTAVTKLHNKIKIILYILTSFHYYFQSYE